MSQIDLLIRVNGVRLIIAKEKTKFFNQPEMPSTRAAVPNLFLLAYPFVRFEKAFLPFS